MISATSLPFPPSFSGSSPSNRCSCRDTPAHARRLAIAGGLWGRLVTALWCPLWDNSLLLGNFYETSALGSARDCREGGI